MKIAAIVIRIIETVAWCVLSVYFIRLGCIAGSKSDWSGFTQNVFFFALCIDHINKMKIDKT